MAGRTRNKRGKRKRGRPPKKKTKRKRASKKTAVKTSASKQHYFVLCNGKPVKNIKELADIMEDLEEHVFDHHVREDSNDFAKWIEDIFKDVELAKKISGAKNKKHMQLVIYRHIAHKLW